MVQFYFIRHGQSTNNVLMEMDYENYLYKRAVDPELTEDGEKQAALTADYLAQPYQNNGFDPQNRSGFGLTHLYCSLMIRAVKTGEIISKKTGLPLVALPEVHETGGMFYAERGEDEPIFVGQPGPGRSYFQKEFPGLILPDDLPEEGWWGREKEPREEYLDRAQSVIDRLLRDHSGKEHRVGIVMHGGIFARILTVLFEIQKPRYWFLMNNCGISRIEISDDGRPMLTYMNKVNFLPDHLVT